MLKKALLVGTLGLFALAAPVRAQVDAPVKEAPSDTSDTATPEEIKEAMASAEASFTPGSASLAPVVLGRMRSASVCSSVATVLNHHYENLHFFCRGRVLYGEVI